MSTQRSASGGRLATPVGDSDHVLGPPAAPVTLVEYGDYQCPYCGAAYPVIKELLRRRPDTVRFAYRHFPITNTHPYAESAAEAAEAAGYRQHFWPVHAWQFTHQDQLDPESVQVGLSELGLDADRIAEEVRSHRYLGKVRSDFVGGVHSGVNGTPTFFINDLRHDGGHTLPDLLSAVDAAVHTAAGPRD